MPAKYPASVLSVFGALVIALAAQPQPPELQDVLHRLDQAAQKFRGMSAKIERKDYTAVLKDTSTQTGTVAMKKLGEHGLQGVMDITAPDKVSYAFNGGKFEKYTPTMNTVEEYDVGAKGEELERFLMLGFGTSGAELLNSYQVKFGGNDTVNGQNTVRLELTPTAADAKKYMKEVDLWIPQGGNYPVQEKMIQPSGDYTLVTYSDVDLHPNLTDKNLRLNPPKGVKRIKP
ncbi:MAG TPA: outer membrane lipoprotein carrier protein LolA [Bryobacteraceae bacterium]|nr:outer membrane lipoprotein carrier protein LolA [Bryobacteraceae bacterium]